MQPHKKYFFFDFDGTLTIGHTACVPPDTRQALHDLQKNGHFVAIATGRLQAEAIGFCPELGISHLVSDGGYSLTIDGRLEQMRSLDASLCHRVLSELSEKGIPWGFTCENKMVRYTNSTAFLLKVNDSYMHSVLDPALDFRRVSTFYKLYIACTEEEEAGIEALSYAPWVRYSPTCIFIEPLEKQEGIRQVMQRLNAPVEDVVVFGDGTNDIPMFTQPWTSIAMGNAHESLKRCADYVTAPSYENGIAKACRHFGWL